MKRQILATKANFGSILAKICLFTETLSKSQNLPFLWKLLNWVNPQMWALKRQSWEGKVSNLSKLSIKTKNNIYMAYVQHKRVINTIQHTQDVLQFNALYCKADKRLHFTLYSVSMINKLLSKWKKGSSFQEKTFLAWKEKYADELRSLLAAVICCKHGIFCSLQQHMRRVPHMLESHLSNGQKFFTTDVQW